MSISFGHFAKAADTNLDSIYSFSDDEGVSGYQQLIKPPGKPVNKKEKKEKKPSKHHKNPKPNGKPTADSGSGSELKHLLTTIQVTPSTIKPQCPVRSSPKSAIAPATTTKKHKKSKSSKKDRECTLSKTEASILDGIFADMNREAELYSQLHSKPSSNTTIESSSQSIKPALVLNAQSPSVNPVKVVMNDAGIHEQSCAKEALSSHKSELTPPTLNKIQDVAVTPGPAASDSFSEMPPLIPVNEPRSTKGQHVSTKGQSGSTKGQPGSTRGQMPPLIPENEPIADTNKFQNAFLLQLAESLKASKAKSDKNSKAKPKKSRSKDKDKESSKKVSKKDGKPAVSRKEGKPKEQKKPSRPPKQKTSHLAELLRRPGSLDLSSIDPKKMVNGFYVAGTSSSCAAAPESSQPESMVPSMVPTPVVASSPLTINTSSNHVNSKISSLTSPNAAETVQRPAPVEHHGIPEPMKVNHHIIPEPVKVDHVIPEPMKVDHHMIPEPMKVDHLDSKQMSSGVLNQYVQSFDSMDDDILQNCIDPNLLHKPSSRGQRSNSMDVGMLQRESNTAHASVSEDVYQFLPNLSTSEKQNAVTKDNKKKAGNKSKTKPKPKPKPKKKKASNPNCKPVPRGRSNSLPSSNYPMEAQIPNGMSSEMIQGMLSPGSRSNHDTLLEVERTQHHIVSSILHDHAHQAASPEQLLQRQRAAMIMQEKFRELQQLQLRMQMSQQMSQPARSSMPPLVELRRPPKHMRFPGPRHPGQQNAAMQIPVSPAASMISDMDRSLTSPRHAQPMMSPSPQASLPPQSPQQSPNPQWMDHSSVSASPKSMVAPSPKGVIPVPSPKSMIPPPSPKSVPVPSPMSMLPSSPTSMPPPSPQSGPPSSMPPPSPQSGPPSSNSMMAASPQSMLPPSPQANLQARLQQTSPTPGPTSPMMQGRSLAAAGVPPNPRMMTSQARMQGNMAPHSVPGNTPHGMMSQPMLSPRTAGVMSPPTRFPSTSPTFGGPMPPGHERHPYPYQSPLPSPQSSPTGVPSQRLPPLHALLRNQVPPSPHGMSSAPVPSSHASQPVQSPHASPNHHQQNPVFQRGIPPGQFPISPGQQSPDKHCMPVNHAMPPGHFRPNVPIQNMPPRPGGFPVPMGYPSPPPGYGSPTSANIPRMPVDSDFHQSPRKPSVGIVNPWEWSISDVIQFIADAGEAGCAEPFRRQVSPHIHTLIYTPL